MLNNHCPGVRGSTNGILGKTNKFLRSNVNFMFCFNVIKDLLDNIFICCFYYCSGRQIFKDLKYSISKYIVIEKQFREYYYKVLFKLSFNFSNFFSKVLSYSGKSCDIINILESKIVNMFNIFTDKLCNNYCINGIGFSFSKGYGLSKPFNKCRVNETDLLFVGYKE